MGGLTQCWRDGRLVDHRVAVRWRGGRQVDHSGGLTQCWRGGRLVDHRGAVRWRSGRLVDHWRGLTQWWRGSRLVDHRGGVIQWWTGGRLVYHRGGVIQWWMGGRLVDHRGGLTQWWRGGRPVDHRGGVTVVEGWSPGWPQGRGDTVVDGWSLGWPQGRGDTVVDKWSPGWPQGRGDTVVDGWSLGGVTAWCARQGERQCQRRCSHPAQVPRLVFGRLRIPRSLMRWNTSAHSLNFVPWVTNSSINVTKAVKSMFFSKSGFELVDKWRNTESPCTCEKLLTRPAATAITNKSRWTRIMEKASSTQTLSIQKSKNKTFQNEIVIKLCTQSTK